MFTLILFLGFERMVVGRWHIVALPFGNSAICQRAGGKLRHRLIAHAVAIVIGPGPPGRVSVREFKHCAPASDLILTDVVFIGDVYM
jgi:hypothetical protein